MFGGEDPFAMFGHMRRQMHMMDQMMDSMMDPFGMMGGGHPRISPFSMIDNGQSSHQVRPRMMHPHQLAHPFGGLGFGGLFGAMNQMQHHAASDPHSHMYSHSTVMTFGPDGQQRVVEHTTSKAGDVRETRRRVRDGEKDEMAIGHSIGDRTHIIEKKRDKDGNVRSQQKFINLGEEEAMEFDREYQTRARNNVYRSKTDPAARNAIENGAHHGSTSRYGRYSDGAGNSRASDVGASRTNAPIVTLPEEEDDIQEIPNPHAPTSSTSRGSGGGAGPIIREISEEEAESSVSKRRKNSTGRFYPGDY
ncbi:unnamed protein product, partial [Mesorhabditis belari]|uniref:Myeloid leukemia factor n=1 Tax=Mesorhabditis belari TaxID=2138241 RepID=A0AAF3FG44_9BILA